MSSAIPAARFCPSTTRCANSPSATSSSATSREQCTWPTAMRAPPAELAWPRHLRTRRHQHGHRHRHSHDGLHPRGLHHRTGLEQSPRLRCLPGDRHHRHHSADHQAQLPRHARRRYRSRHRARPSYRAVRPPGPRARRHHQGRPAGLRRPKTLPPPRRAPIALTPCCAPTPTPSSRLPNSSANAKRPVIFAGHGMIQSGAREQVRTLAERCRSPSPLRFSVSAASLPRIRSRSA